jgi:hypothetical protein
VGAPEVVEVMRDAQQERRGGELADRSVQGKLLFHISVHWCAFLVATTAFMIFVEMMSGNPQDAFSSLWDKHMATLLALLVLGPIFVRDLVRFSDRFAGPIVRLRREMKKLAAGEAVAPLQFREDDFWTELADDFSVIANQLQSSAQRARAPPCTQGGADEKDRRDTIAKHTTI